MATKRKGVIHLVLRGRPGMAFAKGRNLRLIVGARLSFFFLSNSFEFL